MCVGGGGGGGRMMEGRVSEFFDEESESERKILWGVGAVGSGRVGGGG